MNPLARKLSVVQGVERCLPNSRSEKDAIAHAIGVPLSSLYQWQQLSDGSARMKIPAQLVGAFCRETKNTLVAEIVAHQVERAMRDVVSVPVEALSLHEVLLQLKDPFDLAMKVCEDGTLTDKEIEAILKELVEAVEALQNLEKRRRRVHPAFGAERI